MIEFDVSDLNRVAKQYELASAKAIPELQAILRQSAVNIAKELRQDVRKSSSRRWRSFSNTINWNEEIEPDGFTYEIGPRPGRQGHLAGVVYDGGGRQNSRTAPRADMSKPLRNEEARLLAKVDALISRLA